MEVMCEVPARIFGIYPRKGALQIGSDGDVVIVDLKRRMIVKNEMIHSRPQWTILEGREITGWPIMTIRRGELLAEWPDGEPKSKVVAKTKGQYLARRPGSRFLI